MKQELIPNEIMKYFQANTNIGRDDLSKLAGISNQEARYYVRLYKDLHKNAANVIKRGVALFDIHYPEHSKSCLNIVYKFLHDFKPDYVVLGGDQMDLNCISHHNKGKVRLLENARLKRDYQGFQSQVLDKIEANIPKRCKKYFMIGNHEYWIEQLVDDNANLEGLVEIENNLKLTKWDIIQFNKVLTLGEMNFIHGFYTNKYFAEKNIRTYGKNVFCGHLHTHQIYTIISPLNCLPKSGVGVGCLCNVNPHYMKNKPNKWINQFIYWYELEDGTFRYYIVTILNGVTVINEKIYFGNEK